MSDPIAPIGAMADDPPEMRELLYLAGAMIAEALAIGQLPADFGEPWQPVLAELRRFFDSRIDSDGAKLRTLVRKVEEESERRRRLRLDT